MILKCFTDTSNGCEHLKRVFSRYFQLSLDFTKHIVTIYKHDLWLLLVLLSSYVLIVSCLIFLFILFILFYFFLLAICLERWISS